MPRMPVPKASPPPESVIQLVQRFAEHRETYKQQTYNETQVRREFIDPLFKALGWDIDNEGGNAEAYKDVIHEDAIKVGGSTKAPDYCFRIGGVRKFFVEAKKPAEDIKQKREHAYQLRRYAWTAKLPVSILTDFEEFAVFDCTKRPKPTDSASTGRTLYVTFEEYPRRWGDISSVFSKDAILKGAFDKYAESAKRKRGTAEVDTEFLKEIEQWRDLLARNIALRNPSLTVRELNYAVSKTIDRIIFLRMCEDRGVETYAQLRILPNAPAIYPRLVELFRRADQRYNSGLFHFEHEKDRTEEPDTLTPGLTIDDKVLKDIINRLYYPECPYEFSVMPSEILGQVYEQFLGKVIRLTKGHRAVVEEKPEVKKAGGVYYTPKYIVDYIVEHTVGKLLEDKTPADVGPMLDQRKTTRRLKQSPNRHRSRQGAPNTLRILDPACGSGSFLLGAYQYLLDWHLRWYADDDPEAWAKKKNPPIYQSPKPDPTARGTTWRLTVAERKRILLNNIHGVDIDPQAVEVTKLSLLLKVLEGESQQTLDNQFRLFHERALPDLAANIKCGNSLIGPDFYDNQQMTLLDEEERYRINVFDWETEFAGIMNTGGFDAVIGNPPYIRIHNLVDYYPQEVRYIQSHWYTAQFGKVDIYVAFIERGLGLVGDRGYLGFIVPNKFLQSNYGRNLREMLLRERAIAGLVDFRALQVFGGATTYTCLLFLRRKPSDRFSLVIQTGEDEPRDVLQSGRRGVHTFDSLDANAWSLGYTEDSKILHLLRDRGIPLRAVAREMITGVKTGSNRIFVLEDDCLRDEQKILYKYTGSAILRRYLKAENIRRYHLTPATRFAIYPYRNVERRTRPIPVTELAQAHPEVWAYLRGYQRELESRQKGKLKGPSWYAMSFSSSLSMFDAPKIITPTLAPRNRFAFDADGYLFPQGAGGGTGIVIAEPYSPMYVLGVLNSRPLTFFFQRISSRFQGGWYAYEPRYLERIPIRQIDFSNTEDMDHHDRMVDLVERMLSLHKQLATAKTPTDKKAIQRQIDATDRQIDQLVYELYGLTDDEIRIVEEATAG